MFLGVPSVVRITTRWGKDKISWYDEYKQTQTFTWNSEYPPGGIAAKGMGEAALNPLNPLVVAVFSRALRRSLSRLTPSKLYLRIQYCQLRRLPWDIFFKAVLTGQISPKRSNFEARYQLCSNLWLPYPKVIFTVESEWDTHLVEETRKMAYFERVTRPRIKQSQTGVPSNHHKQWHCDLFASGNNSHKPLRVYVARVRGSYRVITRVLVSSAQEIQSKQFFLCLSGEFSLLNGHSRDVRFRIFIRSKYVDMIIFSDILAGSYAWKLKSARSTQFDSSERDSKAFKDATE